MRTRFAGWPERDVADALRHLGDTRDRVLDGARLAADEIVVDVGAGTGLLTLGAVDRVGPDGEVLAVDVSVDALEELRANATAANISYLVGRADVLPFPDATVDAIVTRSVLIYVDDKAEASREFVRVLRSAGRVSLFEPINRRNLRLWQAVDLSPLGALADRVQEWTEAFYANRDDPMLNFDERDLERLFGASGLADVRVELRVDEQEIPGERYVNQVGAPGRPTLLQRWRDAFPDDADRLAAFVSDQAITTRVETAFLTGRKP